MPPLNIALSNFIETINDGPDKLRPDLFDGDRSRILLGLKAHANTINHARLIALEETFPLTKVHMGSASFNRVSAEYIETEYARASSANDIGRHFAAFLTDAAAHELAQIEWAWLLSYNAQDAAILSLSDLSGLTEDALLSLKICAHPSVQIVAINTPISSALAELADEKPAAILCVRPFSQVRVMSIDVVQKKIFDALSQNKATIGNLLNITIERSDEASQLEPVIELINAGALMKAA
jgi:hypothetical protein